MTNQEKWPVKIALWLGIGLISLAASADAIYFTEYYDPILDKLPLNWCLSSGKVCGRPIADAYCRTMGHKRASEYHKSSGLGLSRFGDNRAVCDDGRCDGFHWIVCENDHIDSSYYTSLYRDKTFYYPRVGDTRVSWCYKNAKGCGYRAATAFCRWQGFLHVDNYRRQAGFGLTREIAGGQLCVGPQCQAFEYISCRHM